MKSSHIKLIYLLFIITVASTVTGCKSTNESYASRCLKHYDKLINYVNVQDYDKALKEIDEIEQYSLWDKKIHPSDNVDIKSFYQLYINSKYIKAEILESRKEDDKATKAYRLAYIYDNSKRLKDRQLIGLDYLRRYKALINMNLDDLAINALTDGMKLNDESYEELFKTKLYILKKKEKWQEARDAILEYSKTHKLDDNLTKELTFLETR